MLLPTLVQYFSKTHGHPVCEDTHTRQSRHAAEKSPRARVHPRLIDSGDAGLTEAALLRPSTTGQRTRNAGASERLLSLHLRFTFRMTDGRLIYAHVVEG